MSWSSTSDSSNGFLQFFTFLALVLAIEMLPEANEAPAALFSAARAASSLAACSTCFVWLLHLISSNSSSARRLGVDSPCGAPKLSPEAPRGLDERC